MALNRPIISRRDREVTHFLSVGGTRNLSGAKVGQRNRLGNHSSYIGPIITVIVYIRRSRSKVDCRLHLRETWIGRKLPRRLSERSVRECR